MAFGFKSQSNSSYFFVGCRKILMSYSADGIKRPSQLVPESEEPICIVVGAIAKVSQYYQSWPLIQLLWLSVIIPLFQGAIVTDYTEENISISNYPLSAALCCSKLCDAFEQAWGVI